MLRNINADDCDNDYTKKSDGEIIMTETQIPFPFQHIEAFLRGEVSFDIACDSTMEECYRLIEEYIANHKDNKDG